MSRLVLLVVLLVPVVDVDAAVGQECLEVEGIILDLEIGEGLVMEEEWE